MYCRKCGKEITNESKYCQFCGALQETDETTGTDTVKKSTEQTINEMKEQIVHAVIMGYLYREKDEQMGTILMIAGVAGAIFGVLLGMSMSY